MPQKISNKHPNFVSYLTDDMSSKYERHTYQENDTHTEEWEWKRECQCKVHALVVEVDAQFSGIMS